MRKRKLLYGVGINDSENNISIHGKHTSTYRLWASMLMRCYSKKYVAKHQSYAEVIVCDSWLRLKIFENDIKTIPNYNMWSTHGWYLDKDLFGKTPKIYSKDTCCFLPQELNCFISNEKSNRNGLPTGVTWHKNNRRYQVDMKIDGKSTYLGSFSNIDDALLCYRESRKNKLLGLISKYEDKLDEITKSKLNCWRC